MNHLGDITKIDGSIIEPVDCITFGSPCQDLSTAGKRAGLQGQRSGLFMEAVRIIKEMRKSTNGGYPAFAVGENVPGAYSSNKGEDFRSVLEELARIKDAGAVIPGSAKGKWTKSGCIMADGWSIAWRLHNAKFWGVPQSRRRIAVVVDFAGERAPKILFERKSVQRDFEKGRYAWKAATGAFEKRVGFSERALQHDNGSDTYGFYGQASGKTGNIGYAPERVPTLRVGNAPNSLCIDGNMVDRDSNQNGTGICKDVSFALNTVDRHCVVYENHAQDGRIKELGRISGTASSHYGTGGNNTSIVLCMATGQGDAEIRQNECTALTCNHDNPVISIAVDCRNGRVKKEIGTLKAKDSGGQSLNYINPILQEWKQMAWVIRRITPTECERLQGYPDGWTDIGAWTDEKGKSHKESSDSERYRALGNSIALPFWSWMLKRMAQYLPDQAKLGSLFDGIGGFPFVWEKIHGPGTAAWASEIEPFCIAVTKRRFRDEQNE